jgi:hypothetical protein
VKAFHPKSTIANARLLRPTLMATIAAYEFPAQVRAQSPA